MRLRERALTINATTTLCAARWRVFEFVSDPLNQCWLAEYWIDACADVRLLGANRPRNLLMLVEPPHGPRAFVLWEIESADGEHADPTATVVKLQAVIQPRGLRDRVLMIAGGADRLRDRANLALQELGRAVGPGPDQPRAGAWLTR